VIVIDPRMTRTAAHATDYVRMRPGTDIPLLYGMLWHIFKNGWEDKEFIRQRVYGMDEVRQEIEKWPPDEVQRVTGVPEAQLKRVAETVAKQKPACVIWAMGQTQHTVGTANVRASCILLLATGNVGGVGNGANPFRGHDNVQGASDMGLDITSLPFYTGLTEGAWKHWSRVWETDFEWLRDRFDNPKMMNTSGIPATRWFDAAMLPKDQVEQKDNLKAMMVLGHSPNTFTRIPVAARGVEKLDLLVVCDPHPTQWAILGERKNGTYLLPTCTQYENRGTRTASNGSLQAYQQIVKPLFESKSDGEILYLLAKKFGFADQMFKSIKVENGQPLAEDVVSEYNRGGWSTGYSGQSPERLKAHLRNQAKFDPLTLRAPKDDPEVGGDYYGLPWPCWGKPELKHPGTPILYNTNLHVMDGGGTFRARFGVEREVKLPDGTTRKDNLLAEGSYSVGSEIKDGYPEFTYGVLKKLAWDRDLTPEESAVIESIGGTSPDAVSWSTDLSGGIQRVAMAHGCVPYGNAKARAIAWNLPDPIPVHREPIYTPRADLVAKYPTRPNEVQFRVPNLGFDVQKAGVDKGIAKRFPLILTSGRLVEYEGGGEESRSNRWLAELQQDMFIEINPSDAAERGIIKSGAWVLVSGPEMASGNACRMKAMLTERVGKGVTWMPFHFAGWFQGVDQRSRYPAGTDPIVLGESVNTVTTYGYDPMTGMQEPKATLCQVRAA
jgi:formate dehydrogenase major subunit